MAPTVSPPRARRKVEWELLSGKDLDRPGAMLINLIMAAATDRQIGLTDIGTEALGIVPSYFHGLRTGEKSIATLGDQYLSRAATFLGMPKVAVLAAAGRLDSKDLIAEPATFHKFLMPALRIVQLDPDVGHFVPASIIEADPAIQRCVVVLYQKARGVSLIPEKLLTGTIAEQRKSQNSRIPTARSRRNLEWELLSGQDLQMPGATLINLILVAALERRISMRQIGKEALDISSSYFGALRKGKRPMVQLGERHIDHAAAFLGISKVAALVVAGRLELEDFYADPAVYRKHLSMALTHIQHDPDIGHFVPATILEADRRIKGCLVTIYEKATGLTLIPGKVSAEAIAERHQYLMHKKG